MLKTAEYLPFFIQQWRVKGLIRKKSIFIILAVIMILSAAIFINKNAPSKHQLTITDALNTVCDITVIDDDSLQIATECQDIIYKYDALLSVTNPMSDVYKINSSKNGATVSDEILYLLSECEKFYYDTENRFDVTSGSLFEIWNEVIKSSTLPDEATILNGMKTSGYQNIELDFENSTVVKKNSDLKINFGSVAKGYITDRIAKKIKFENPRGALINLGGNVYAYGKNQNGKSWNIGIKDPDDSSAIIGSIRVSDEFVITSGDYERFAQIDSKKYHHIIDATTGYPADTGLKSVTIISDNGMICDILSTSCFLLGIDKSKELLKKYTASAIFVTDNNFVYYSEELENDFIKSSNNYIYKKLY